MQVILYYVLERPQVANITKSREDREKQSNGFTKADHGHCAQQKWLSCNYISTFTITNRGIFTTPTATGAEEGKVIPFLNKNCASKQHRFSWPAASSLSPDPTGHLCCRTRSPPHNPEAPAATPSPSPQPPTLKQVIITMSSQKAKMAEYKLLTKLSQTSSPWWQFCSNVVFCYRSNYNKIWF